MTMILTPDTPRNVEPHNFGGERDGGEVPTAWAWHASELHQQHGSTVRGWGGPPLSAERYEVPLWSLMSIFHVNSITNAFGTNAPLLGLKESAGMSWADSKLLAETMDEVRRQLGVVYDQDNAQWCGRGSSNIGITIYLLGHIKVMSINHDQKTRTITRSSLIILLTFVFLSIKCKNIFC